MTNTVQYRGTLGSNVPNTGSGASPNIWSDCKWNLIDAGIVNGVQFFDHFAHGGIITSPTTVASLGSGTGWSGFGSSGSTITWDDAQGGGIVLAETTVDEGVVLTHDQHAYVLSNVAGNFFWEARIKLLLTATTENSWVAGLMDTTAVTAIVPLTAAGAVADVNFVGFHKPEANTTAYDTSYKADGVTLVEVNSDVGAIADATYFKVGMKMLAKDHVLRFYINGIEQANTKTIVNALGTSFPSDVRLGLVFAMAVGAAASDNTMTIDWVRVSQELVD